ncbi:MAG TPA: hypothetical protein VK466_00245 [Terriglobales bacterium]|nr:hypothetical protein [Terriglobales bacterium]
MSDSTTTRFRHQIFRLHQQKEADLDFGLGEILPPEEVAAILEEEGATWKSIVYTPLLTHVWGETARGGGSRAQKRLFFQALRGPGLRSTPKV